MVLCPCLNQVHKYGLGNRRSDCTEITCLEVCCTLCLSHSLCSRCFTASSSSWQSRAGQSRRSQLHASNPGGTHFRKGSECELWLIDNPHELASCHQGNRQETIRTCSTQPLAVIRSLCYNVHERVSQIRQRHCRETQHSVVSELAIVSEKLQSSKPIGQITDVTHQRTRLQYH